MTWKQFKEEVDRQLEEKGVPEDTEIFIIDWPSGYDTNEVEVYDDNLDEGLSIH